MPDDDPLLTAAEARDVFGIPPSTTNRWVKEKRLEVAGGRPHNRRNPSKFRRSDLAALAATRQPNRSDPERDRQVVAVFAPLGLPASTVYSILRRHENRLRTES